MRRVEYRVDALLDLFRVHRIATLDQLQEALGTDVRMTVLRKLRRLGYRSSYTHGGKYYSLDRLLPFDKHGLWFYRDVGFSHFGTLLSTVEVFVQGARMGYRVGELDRVLRVSTKESLLQLVRQGRVVREGNRGRYLYYAKEAGKRREQVRSRAVHEALIPLGASASTREVSSEELKAAILLFYSLLDERQRRLYGGLESLKLGYGGDESIAQLLGVDAHTVGRGRQALLEGDVQTDRVRRSGGGRPSVEKKRRK